MATSKCDLFLEGFTPTVKVLPVVYFSILDHYQRRAEGQGRVIGTLLGTVTGTRVDVTNCFPVPHSETEEQVAVDMEYHRTMFELQQRVNPQETIVGWYATGNEITEHSTLIHDFYSRETDNPVHLCVDTTMQSGHMGVLAVVSAPMGVPQTAEDDPDAPVATGTLFTPINCEIVYHEAERIAVELLQDGIKKDGSATLIDDLDHVAQATEQMQKMISTCIEYVDKVSNGEIEGDLKVGKFLLDTVSAVPKLDPAQFEKLFNSTLQDLLMIQYLAKLAQSQVSIQQKLGASIQEKS